MRVALLTPSIAFGGDFETPVVRLFAETMAKSVDLHVFPVLRMTRNTTSTASSMTLHSPPQHQSRFSLRMVETLVSMRRMHSRTPFDLLHALWLHEPGTIAVAAGSMLGVPVVASIGGAEVVALQDIDYGALRQPWGRFMTAHVLQRATIVTGGSTYVVRQARRVVPHRDPGRFRLAPLPVATDRYAQSNRPTFDANAPRLLHVASLIPVKDQTTLLHAFRRVIDVIPGARLSIIGEDPFGARATLESIRDQFGLTSAVEFSGPRAHAEMDDLYRSADLLVLSSRHESQAMVVLEAAAAGIPTVGSAVGVVSDLAPDAAVAVRPGDPIALADAATAILTDPVRLSRMGTLARAHVLGRYDAPVVCETFLEIYADAIRLSGR